MAQNKSIKDYSILAYFSIAVIVASLFFLGLQFTGYATSTDEAIVNVTISSTTAINFTTDFIDFGSGAVTTGSDNATLDTDGTIIGGSWGAVSSNFTLENIGNTNVNLSLRVGKSAQDFIGGNNPSYEYKYANNEVTSCVNSTTMAVWTSTSTSDTYLCSFFNALDGNDTINIGVRIVIPSTATGAKTDTFTALLYLNIYKLVISMKSMISKKVAVTLFIIALVLVGIVVANYFVQQDSKISTQQLGDSLDDNGNGKIGIKILTPQVEDKSNGSE
jgi:hypothetical protein